MIRELLSHIPVMAANINWTDIIDPISRMFTAPNGIFGSELIAALFLFMVFLILTAVFGMGMLIGSVIIIPSMFLVFEYIPTLKIAAAIIIGLLFGIGLNKLVKR